MSEPKEGTESAFGLERKCPNCGSIIIIRDYSSGEDVCKACGRVIKEESFDRGPEWRAFDQEEREKKSRAGPPRTETIHDRGLSTQIDHKNRDARGKSFAPEKRSKLYRMRKWHKRAKVEGAKDRNLSVAFGELGRMVSQLGLPKNIQEGAARTYREVAEKGIVRGRSIEGMVTATIYLECKRAGVPRTLEELAEVSRVDKKEIGRNYRDIAEKLDVGPQLSDPASLVPRFGSELGVSGETRARAIKIIKKAENEGLNVGTSPTGTAAAAVYIACLKTGERRTQKEVSEAAGVTEMTVRNRYKKIVEELGIEEADDATPVKETVDKGLPKPSEVETKIENIVASVDFEGINFDLEIVSRMLDGAEYDSDKFPGVSYHLEEPEASFLIFGSGQANCVGADSLEGMEKAVEKLTQELESGGIQVDRKPEVEVQNVVVQVDFEADLNLEDIHRSSLRTSYDPETFPGLSIELEEGKGDFLLFASGEGVCHLKNLNDLELAVEEMLENLRQFVGGDV